MALAVALRDDRNNGGSSPAAEDHIRESIKEIGEGGVEHPKQELELSFLPTIAAHHPLFLSTSTSP